MCLVAKVGLRLYPSRLLKDAILTVVPAPFLFVGSFHHSKHRNLKSTSSDPHIPPPANTLFLFFLNVQI